MSAPIPGDSPFKGSIHRQPVVNKLLPASLFKTMGPRALPSNNALRNSMLRENGLKMARSELRPLASVGNLVQWLPPLPVLEEPKPYIPTRQELENKLLEIFDKNEDVELSEEAMALFSSLAQKTLNTPQDHKEAQLMLEKLEEFVRESKFSVESQPIAIDQSSVESSAIRRFAGTLTLVTMIIGMSSVDLKTSMKIGGIAGALGGIGMSSQIKLPDGEESILLPIQLAVMVGGIGTAIGAMLNLSAKATMVAPLMFIRGAQNL